MDNGSRRGFTLIELLVVIAIIAILAAILFPVMTSVKERGKQTQCLANMSQLGKALQMYADDSDDRLPIIRLWDNNPAHNWCGSFGFSGVPAPNVKKGQLFRYARAAGVYECPSDKNTKATWFPNCRFTISYSMNFSLEMNNAGFYQKRLGSIPSWRARKAMLMIHESRKTINDGDFNLDATDDIGDVHWDGTNILYCDLHTAYRSKKRLKAEKPDWDLRDLR